MQSLAIKYRPKTWDDVVEQSATKTILTQQLASGEVKNAYLFCGGAGTGKTTCARIFANEINKGAGVPTEMDAASNNSVDDVRKLIDKARTTSIDSEYNIFILDEVHALSNSAWQAMLKILEEPPKKSIFIMCTTDPQKIPKTILSRVQRYDFQRISQVGIRDRLCYILGKEFEYPNVESEAIEYIAKLAEGGMRDAITMLDKCLAYNEDLTIENVIQALGTSNIEVMLKLTDSIIFGEAKKIVKIINELYMSGKDLKLFIRQYIDFILDVNKVIMLGSMEYTKLPDTKEIQDFITEAVAEGTTYVDKLLDLLDEVIKLSSAIKWDTSPKSVIEATLITFSRRNNK